MSSFRVSVWDPSLIIGQMICLQSVFYSTQAVLMFFWSFAEYKPSVDHILSAQTIRPMTFIQLLSAVICAYALFIIVCRARQCLDFTCTMHFWHLLLVCLYNWTFPTQITWWLLQLLSIVICTVIGEYLCMKKETLEIPLISQNKIVEA